MKPPPFQYHDPKTVADAIAILQSELSEREAARRRAISYADVEHALRAAGTCD